MGLYAQKRSSYQDIKLQTPQDYAKAEKPALEASEYILSTPIDKGDKAKEEATRFLLAWMDGTPDYVFPLNPPIDVISKIEPGLLAVFMASMTKYVLDESKTASEEEINLHGFENLADYCMQKKNHVEIRGEIKNLVEAKKDGNLQDYLDQFSTNEKKGIEV